MAATPALLRTPPLAPDAARAENCGGEPAEDHRLHRGHDLHGLGADHREAEDPVAGRFDERRRWRMRSMSRRPEWRVVWTSAPERLAHVSQAGLLFTLPVEVGQGLVQPLEVIGPGDRELGPEGVVARVDGHLRRRGDRRHKAPVRPPEGTWPMAPRPPNCGHECWTSTGRAKAPAASPVRRLSAASRWRVCWRLAVVGQEAKGNLRLDTPAEVRYYRHGGTLPYLLRRLRGAQSGSQEGRPPYNPPTIFPASTHPPGIKTLAGRNPPRGAPASS